MPSISQSQERCSSAPCLSLRRRYVSALCPESNDAAAQKFPGGYRVCRNRGVGPGSGQDCTGFPACISMIAIGGRENSGHFVIGVSRFGQFGAAHGRGIPVGRGRLTSRIGETCGPARPEADRLMAEIPGEQRVGSAQNVDLADGHNSPATNALTAARAAGAMAAPVRMSHICSTLTPINAAMTGSGNPDLTAAASN